MIAAVQTVDGVVLVDVEEETVLGAGEELPEADAPSVQLPRLVAAARAGARSPRVDGARHRDLATARPGRRRGGLAGVLIAMPRRPSRMLYTGATGSNLARRVFWRALTLELTDIVAVAWID